MTANSMVPSPSGATRDPFYLHDLTLILAWTSNFIHFIVWDSGMKLLFHSSTSTVALLKFANGFISNFIPHFTGHMITYPWELKLSNVSKRGPRSSEGMVLSV